MKVKNLSSNIPMSNVLLKMPEEVYNASSLPEYGISKDTPVIYKGYIMGDYFVATKNSKDQVFPLFNEFFDPKSILEWEVHSIIP